jgi:thymidylate kinase
MFTVALIGPDGSGKSLVSKRLAGALPELPIKRIYMGINLEASHLMLPSTWLLLALKRASGGRPDMAGPGELRAPEPRSGPPLKRLASEAKTWALTANRVLEEWFRLVVGWVYQKRGYHLLYDRHFALDFYFYDMQYEDTSKPLARRVHGYLLRHFYPLPDLVICLDAPAELLFARKHEGTLESIERRRQEYLAMRDVAPAFEVIDAAQPVDLVVAQAADAIRRFAAHRTERQAHHPVGKRPAQPAR